MDDAVTAKVRHSFDRQGFTQLLGAELISVTEGTCVVRVPFSESLTQQHGLFHGGVISTLADNAAGLASYSVMGDGEQPLTIEFKISYLDAGVGDALEARGKVLRAGRRIKHAQTEVFALNEEGEKLIAVALVTMGTMRSLEQKS